MNEKFIPLAKLGKKARKQADTAKRRIWDCSPVSHVVADRKKYDRNRINLRGRNDDGDGFFVFCETRAIVEELSKF